MTPGEQALLQRQLQLRLRSAELRQRIGSDAQVLRGPLMAADSLRAGARWLRRHPEVPVGLAVLAVAVRPSRVWHWGWRLWGGWQAWRRIERWLVSGGLRRRR